MTSHVDQPADYEWTIEPRRPGLGARVSEVWRYRRLLRYFAYRALQKVYARTKLGWLWLVIRPLFPLTIKTVVFNGMLGVSSAGVPYFLFLVAGSTVWELFASSALWATRSLELNRGLIAKLYVPRLLLPMATLTPALVTFAIYLLVLLGAAVYYLATTGVWHLQGPERLGWAAVAVLLVIALALGIGLWTSVPAMATRDVRFSVGYVLGLWMFLTPIVYPMSLVPPRWRVLMWFNPMAAPVETFKWALINEGELNLAALGVGSVMTGLVVVSGLWFFSRAEAEAADRT